MKNIFLKLLIIPCVIALISVYMIGLNFIKRADRTDAQFEISEKTTDISSFDSEDGRININTATADELLLLDGVGEKYALEIIKRREELGGYTSVEQLKSVKGIGEKLFEKIKGYVKVE